jgi:hypothetical protein
MSKNKYNIPDSIFNQYVPEDRVFLANEEDRDLDTIEVPLPEAPPWDTIDNFGLPKDQQMFPYQQMPANLIALQEEQDSQGNFLTQDEIWDKINAERQYYDDDIKWIALQWKRRLEGYWVFIFGKPTFITGWHYMYLNFWELAEGRAEYRDRDRRYFLFADFIYHYKKMYGFIIPKGRRVGLTASASCIMYCIATILHRARVGIQSKDDKSAEDLFQKHIVPGWRAMPFFFRPNTSNSDDPKKILHFSSFITKGKIGAKKRGKKSLQSEISYRASGVKAWDGSKLHGAIQDEIGKLIECNINDRWRTIKLCLSLGGGGQIHGFAILGSTVGEMEQGGGQNMKELCDGSKWSERNKSGQTATGLCILYIPSYDGLSGFIGKYGESIIDTPTKEQLEYLKSRSDWNGEVVGAKAFLEGQIEHLKAIGDKDGIADLQREFPTTFKGCFRTNGRDSFFDIPKIEDRLDELAEMKTAVVKGDFVWEGPKFRSKVRFVPDPEKGKFNLSKILTPAESNRIAWDSSLESYVALNVQYTFGGDTFKANETKSSKNSLGGGAIFWAHEPHLDPWEKPMDQWVSNRLVCTYLHRPSDKTEYEEDMIMLCCYFGAPAYIETNVQDLKDAFIEKGFRSMLVHKFNQEKVQMEGIAGQATDNYTKQQIFKKIQTYIKYHVGRDRHADFLEQVRDITSLQEMTKYDLFTAVGYAMIGSSQYINDIQMVDDSHQQASSEPFFRTFKY